MDYDEQVKDIESNAKFGDLLEFSYPIGYAHWGVYDGDGYVIHFAVANEGDLKHRVRTYLQDIMPVCGDLLLGSTQIRRVPVGEVNVPKGAQVMVSNTRHGRRPSSEDEMRRRRDALLGKEFCYHLFNLNCEHFATFVRYGQAVCNQIPAMSKNKENTQASEVFQKVVDEYET
ncbi:hypothetical protein GJAV_G00183440 [Gymnothorax javanicus]|nr:hypothetical protein GJAV_G00183440 [Gymnothorax javanicus]